MQTRVRYKGLLARVSWTVATDAAALTGAVVFARRGDVVGVWIALSLLLCFSLIGSFVSLPLADVVVSDDGLSRQLWGRTLRQISWQNVKKIRVATVYLQDLRRRVRLFIVFPVRPSGLRFVPSGRIWFREDGNFSELIEHVNRNLAAHEIPVEVEVGSRDPATWTTRDRIDTHP